MKKQTTHSLQPIKLATSATFITATISFLVTILALVDPALKTITPFFQTIYAPLGYTISFTGALLGTAYIAADTFILVYLFAWIYNKLL